MLTRVTIGAGLVLAYFALCAPAWAEEEEDAPTEVPVTVTAEVDESDLETLGTFELKLTFMPEEDVGRPYRIELRLLHRGVELVNLDHSPRVPTAEWRKGASVTYALPVPVPLNAGLPAGDELAVSLRFFDPALEKHVRCRSASRVAHVKVPDFGPVDDPALQQAILDRARALAGEGRKADAWRALEMGIRRAVEDATKYRFRDEITSMGHFAPTPLSLLEQQIVEQRVEAERRRYLRLMAGRYFDRGKLFAALRILEFVGGKVSEEAGAAVIGALAEAKRAQKDILDIKLRIVGKISDEDKAKAQKAIQKHGLTKALLDKAVSWFEAKEYAPARWIFRELSITGGDGLQTDAKQRLDALEAAWVADTPEDQQKLVDEAANHPAFGRVAAVPSHNFIYIGPQILVQSIPNPSKLRFDLSFVFLTDLFGRVPNPGGDRVTVFFKELWDFGGGQGGGKIIDIGKADPDRRGYRVDTGLLYHELTHCIDDTNPILNGFREGLANMGAAYSFDALGQRGDTLHAFGANLGAFQKDYVERDLPYWRIQSYGPSAGFFLHFIAKHSRTDKGNDWKPYRQFFRAYRAAPVRDGREPYVARAIVYYMMRAFGPAVFDDFIRFRFPLVPSDREAVKHEMEAFAKGDYAVARAKERLEKFPNSPLPRDLWARRMISLHNDGGDEDEVRRISKHELGIIHDWRVIGPFSSKGADPMAFVFPPQYEIDFEKDYKSENNVCKWRTAGGTPYVKIDATGWVDFNFNYQDNTATYALTHVTVPDDVDAAIHVRMDDDFVLFVNDELVDGYRNRGQNGSSLVWWRGPYSKHAPDAMKLACKLRKGRNKLLLKVKNRRGKAGFVLAVARTDGRAIEGLKADTEVPEPPVEVERRKDRWKTVVKHRFTTKSFSSKLETKVGKFKVVNQLLQGESTDKGVGWRKYTVRPGFPKDSPSNLFWIKSKFTKDVDDFRLTLDLAPQGDPKFVLTFMGEGGGDGLSGWNLIVHGKGKGRVAARLERYDNLVYQVAPLEYRAKPKKGKKEKKPPKVEEIVPLIVVYEDQRLSVRLGDVDLLKDVSITPIPNRRRIGVSTFGPKLRFAAFKLEKTNQKR